MKKLLLGLLAVILLLVVVIVAVPFLVPADVYRPQLVQAVERATGRDFTIAGDLGVSILPRLGLRATDVSLSNPPDARQPDMLTLEELIVELQPWPLLSGEVRVDSFILVKPVIHLEVDEQGRPNWVFAADTAEEPAPDSGADSGTGAPQLPELSLGDVRLSDGKVTYFDARSGESIELSDIDAEVSLPNLDGPFGIEGDATWREREVRLQVDGESLRGLTGEGATALRAAISADMAELAFEGEIDGLTPAKLGGNVDLNIASIRELAAWTGTPIERPEPGLQTLTIKGRLGVDGGTAAFTDAAVALDQIEGTGELTLDASGSKPRLTARLDLGMLDLNPYLPPAAEPAPSDGGGEPAAAAGWSDEPIDLSALDAANANLELAVGGIRVREIEIGQSALAVSLEDGLLALDLQRLDLYGGSGTGRVTVNARGQAPALETTFELTGVNAGPLLQDAADIDRLEGTGNITLALTTQGQSQRAMVGALGGDGAVTFTDGAIKGINLAAMVRQFSAALQNPQSLGMSADETEKTDFAELSGTFKITDGIARNDDLLLLNPLLRVSGAGEVNLPERQLRFRIVPKVVATLEGQGGGTDLKGLAVPIIAEGPWSNLSFRPDLSGVIEGIAKDPAAAGEAAERAIDQLKEGGLEGVLKGLGGGGEPPPGDGEQQQPEQPADPGQLLRGLLGK